MTTECRVVLIGMMGSGKTTIGRLVAQSMGWPYVDNDELVAAQAGTTAKDLLAGAGVHELRATEAEALRAGLRRAAPVVIGAPAGTILDEELRRELRATAVVVWLTAEPHTLARRARGSAHRPWLDGDAQAWITTTLAQRAPLYASVADLTVSTEAATAGVAATQIVAWLTERCA